jgi:hypothetical protein
MRTIAKPRRTLASVAILLALQLAGADLAAAQQLHKGVTGPQCAAMGGRILSWTNTAGSGPSVGECYVAAAPPRAAPSPPAGNNIGAATEAAIGIFGILSNLPQSQPSEPIEQEPEERPPAAAAPAPGQERAAEIASGIYRLAAQQSRKKDYCRAAENFRLAAQRFLQAGESAAAEDANLQAGLVQADCEDRRAAKAVPIKSGVANEPQGAGTCVPYFQQMRKLFRDNAAVCLKETRLLQSLTDMVGKTSSSGDPTFTRASAPELYAILKPSDPGWTISATHASPRCNEPLWVSGQDVAFSECARVYLCGAAAASCGLRRARQTKTNDCIPISQTCLAQHPVPQMAEEGAKPQSTWEPRVTASPPARPPTRGSTITGRSGPGAGGGGSGGVTSAK